MGLGLFSLCLTIHVFTKADTPSSFWPVLTVVPVLGKYEKLVTSYMQCCEIQNSREAFLNWHQGWFLQIGFTVLQNMEITYEITGSSQQNAT